MFLHKYRNPERGLEVEFDETILNEMLKECASYGKYETGGILAGYYDDSLKKAVIVGSSTAPKDSRHMRSRFHRGVKGLKSWLKEKWDEEKAYYLGEWHFHPFFSSDMSPVDIKQMKEISKDKSYHCPEPILIIIGGDPNNAYSVSIAVFISSSGPVELTEHSMEYL